MGKNREPPGHLHFLRLSSLAFEYNGGRTHGLLTGKARRLDGYASGSGLEALGARTQMLRRRACKGIDGTLSHPAPASMPTL